jgi:hypothetical protein
MSERHNWGAEVNDITWSFCVSIGSQIILFFAQMYRGLDEENRGGGGVIEDIETGKRRHWKRSVSVYGSSVRGTGREASFS